jgi:hypothetical protein
MSNAADVLPERIQPLAAFCVQRIAADVDEAGVQKQEYRVVAGNLELPHFADTLVFW